MKLARPAYLLAVSIILFLALFLRVAPLSQESVDGDELFSRRVAVASTQQGWEMVRDDLVHPPLYYFILKATMFPSDTASALSIRALSLAAGISGIALLFLFGLTVPGLRVPVLLAGLLLAVNKMHIYYSQQARSYAFYCLLVTLLLLWSAVVTRYGHRFLYWTAGTVLMSMIVWTHYIGTLYCAACIFPILFMKDGGIRKRAIISTILAAALFLPWLIPELSVYRAKAGLGGNLGWQGAPSLAELKYTVVQFVGLSNFRGATTVGLAVGVILICCALLPAFKRQPEDLPSPLKSILGIAAVMPPILLFLLTQRPFNLTIFGERHLLPSIVPVVLLMCYGLFRIASAGPRFRSIMIAGLGTVVLCALQITPVYRDWPGPIRQPYEAIANDLRELAPGSPVYTTWEYGIGEPVSFYLSNNRKTETLPTVIDPVRFPQRFILLYRPGAEPEANLIKPLLTAYTVQADRYYSGKGAPTFGTRLLLLQAQ